MRQRGFRNSLVVRIIGRTGVFFAAETKIAAYLVADGHYGWDLWGGATALWLRFFPAFGADATQMATWGIAGVALLFG